MHTQYSLAAAREGRAMNSDEQRADRWERIEAAKAREPQSPRRGSYVCRHCGAGEAMPGHEC